MFAEERKNRIMAMLKKNNRVTVDELVVIFSVSGATIRTDLKDLELLGYIIRTYGGAIIRDDVVNGEDSIKERKDKNLVQKINIAKKARGFIEEGDIIIIDTGTTTFELAKQLNNAKNITVITNDLNIGLELQKNKDITLILIGGKIRSDFECTVGIMGTQFLGVLTANKLFMSANAFSLTKGATTPNIEQAEMKSKMIDISQTVYLLCDSSKMGKRTLCSFATVKKIQCIITDNDLPQEEKMHFEKEGVNVILC